MDQDLNARVIAETVQSSKPVVIAHSKSNKVLGTLFFTSITVILIILALWEFRIRIPTCEGFAALGCWAILAGVLVALIATASATAWLYITSLLHRKLVKSGAVSERHSNRVTIYRYLVPAFIFDLIWLQYNDMFSPNLRWFFVAVLVFIGIAMIITPIVVRADPQAPRDTQ